MIEYSQLVEVNGSEVRDKSLNDVIPMLQGSDEVIRLKLARLMSIPERDFNATMSRSSRYARIRSTFISLTNNVWRMQHTIR